MPATPPEPCVRFSVAHRASAYTLGHQGYEGVFRMAVLNGAVLRCRAVHLCGGNVCVWAGEGAHTLVDRRVGAGVK